MTAPNKDKLTEMARMLDGQMTAHDDMAKAETANIAGLEKALAEAGARLDNHQRDRREVAIQLGAVTALLHRCEDGERYNEREALAERLAKNT